MRRRDCLGASLYTVDSNTGSLTISGGGEVRPGDLRLEAPGCFSDDLTDSNQIEAQGADAIADSVFRNYAVLASVMLPANLATIGLDAFARCGALETLTFQSITVPELEMITGLDTENNPVPVTDNRFTMTESDVTVTAVFAAIPTYFVTVAGLVYEDGTREAIRKSVAGTNSITIPLSGFATVEIVDERREFADVPTDSWYSDAVAFVSAQELFDGTPLSPLARPLPEPIR